MDYNQVIDYLFNQLANYQKSGGTAYKPGLETIQELLSALNNPHRSLKTIHIGGTNGKGSTSHILASILIENGYKVGIFTSPHIKDFRERIKINGKLIEKQLVVDFVETQKDVFDKLNPSFFEITTAMAFSIFKSENCDISIIEVGLGGRLDSTNVILPEVSIITNIGIDHTNFLGNTISAIAKEKAGIIKPYTPVIIGETCTESKPVFINKAENVNAPISFTLKTTKFKTDLLGQFQQQNISTAISAITVLKNKGWSVDSNKTNVALTRIKRNSNFQARLDQVSKNPRIIIDSAHNPDGIKTLFKELEYLKYNQLHCIYGTSLDKDVNSILEHFPKTSKYYFTSFESDRSLNSDTIQQLANKFNLKSETFKDPKKALNTAIQSYKENDLIVVFGSFFLLEKII